MSCDSIFYGSFFTPEQDWPVCFKLRIYAHRMIFPKIFSYIHTGYIFCARNTETHIYICVLLACTLISIRERCFFAAPGSIMDQSSSHIKNLEHAFETIRQQCRVLIFFPSRSAQLYIENEKRKSIQRKKKKHTKLGIFMSASFIYARGFRMQSSSRAPFNLWRWNTVFIKWLKALALLRKCTLLSCLYSGCPQRACVYLCTYWRRLRSAVRSRGVKKKRE